MSWTVMSHRMGWPAGHVVSADDLEGCNIEALVAGGHLSPAPKMTKSTPAPPADNPADGPEEQA